MEKTLISFFEWRQKDMDVLDDMGVSNKLSAKVFLKVNYSFNFEETWWL